MSNTQGLWRRKYVNNNGNVEQKTLLELATMRSAALSKNNCPDFLDVIFYMKYILGFILGLIWGFIPFQGALYMMMYIGLILVEFLPAFYGTYILKVNDEDYPIGTLASESMMPAAAFFVLVWVVAFTVFNI